MTREQSLFPEPEEAHAGDSDDSPALQRAGLLCDYYDWLAVRRTRRVRRLGRALSAATDLAFLPFILIAPSVGFTVWIGTKAATAAVRRALDGRARMVAHIRRDREHARAIPVCELDALDSGTPVRVRGRVRIRDPLASLLEPDGRAAYEWLLVQEERLPERAYFIERGRDFDLVGDGGAAVRVRGAFVRMVVEWHPTPERIAPGQARRVSSALPTALVGRRPLALTSLAAAALSLTDGAEIEVFGYTARVVDPSAVALPRQVPTRSVLTGARDNPLIIMPRAVEHDE